MKKVFHFVKSNNLSGLENVVINICTMVKGYDYTYVSTSGPINSILNQYKIKHIIIPDIKPLTLLKVIKKYNPNIVQAHDPLISVLLSFSFIYCKNHNIKMISELHNTDPKMSSWWRLRSILYLISSFAYNNIISVSKKTLNNYFYSSLIINKNKIIPNVINPYKIKKMIRCVDKNKKWDCIFLGRLTYQKNPFKFIHIIKILKNKDKNIKAVIVGNGNLLLKLKNMVYKYHLRNNVKFVGFQINPYKYMQRSKIIIITSRFEGFCLVALEALLIGIPVVSTPLKVLKHLIGYKCGHFEQNDYAFAKDVNGLLSNPKRYQQYKSLGYKRVKDVNNVNRFINGYKYVYKN